MRAVATLHMRLGTAGLLAVLILLVSATGAAAAIHPGAASHKIVNVSVPKFTLRGKTVTCPDGKNLVSGGAFWHKSGHAVSAKLKAYITSSSPTVNGKGWFAAGDNESTGTLQLTIVIFCRPASATGPYTVETDNVDLAAGAIGGGTVDCPSGTAVVTGGAFWHVAGHGAKASLAGFVGSSAPQGSSGWLAAGGNFSGDFGHAQALRLEIVGLCAATAKVGTVSTVTKDVTIAVNHSGGHSVACPSGQRALGGGAFFHQSASATPDPSVDVSIGSSSPSANGKSWFASGWNFTADVGPGQTLKMRVTVNCVPA